MAGFSESAIGFTENIKLFEKFGLWWVIRAKKSRIFGGTPTKCSPTPVLLIHCFPMGTACVKDTNTHKNPSQEKLFGDMIAMWRFECAGHVQKQLGARLRSYKWMLKGENFKTACHHYFQNSFDSCSKHF